MGARKLFFALMISLFLAICLNFNVLVGEETGRLGFRMKLPTIKYRIENTSGQNGEEAERQ